MDSLGSPKYLCANPLRTAELTHGMALLSLTEMAVYIHHFENKKITNRLTMLL